MGIRRRGYIALEYAVLVAVLVAALLTMQIYMKRGFSGRLRAAADAISQGQGYAPRRTTADLTLSTKSRTLTQSHLTFIKSVDDDNGDGKVDGLDLPDQALVTSTEILSERAERTGQETVGSFSSEKLWE